MGNLVYLSFKQYCHTELIWGGPVAGVKCALQTISVHFMVK